MVKYLALLKGVELVSMLSCQLIDICFDSFLSALPILKHNQYSDILAIKIGYLISQTNKNFCFIRTPGHRNTKGNEVADEAECFAITDPDKEILLLLYLLDVRRKCMHRVFINTFNRI